MNQTVHPYEELNVLVLTPRYIHRFQISREIDSVYKTYYNLLCNLVNLKFKLFIRICRLCAMNRTATCEVPTRREGKTDILQL